MFRTCLTRFLSAVVGFFGSWVDEDSNESSDAGSECENLKLTDFHDSGQFLRARAYMKETSQLYGIRNSIPDRIENVAQQNAGFIAETKNYLATQDDEKDSTTVMMHEPVPLLSWTTMESLFIFENQEGEDHVSDQVPE